MAARNDNQILTDGAGLAAHADDLARSRQEANPDADPELIRRQALTDAALFDSHARNWAYHERRSVGEYYEQNRPEYRSWQPDFDENQDGPDGGYMSWREGETDGERQADALYHVDDNGNAVSPNENNPRVANVVEIRPELLTHEDGTPVNLRSREDMFKWLRKNLQGLTVKIADDGTIQKFTHNNLGGFQLCNVLGEQRRSPKTPIKFLKPRGWPLCGLLKRMR